MYESALNETTSVAAVCLSSLFISCLLEMHITDLGLKFRPVHFATVSLRLPITPPQWETNADSANFTTGRHTAGHIGLNTWSPFPSHNPVRFQLRVSGAVRTLV